MDLGTAQVALELNEELIPLLQRLQLSIPFSDPANDVLRSQIEGLKSLNLTLYGMFYRYELGLTQPSVEQLGSGGVVTTTFGNFPQGGQKIVVGDK